MIKYSKNFVLLMLLVVGCKQASERQITTVETIENPAGENSSLPNLFTAQNGDVYFSWIEKQKKKTQLFFSKEENGQWSRPAMVSEGDNWFVNWADFPSLMVNNDQMAAHWLQKSAEGTYDYDVKVSFSSDAGKNWDTPFTPHTDGVQAEHGFVSMLPMKEGKTFITWLDGRNTKSEGHSAGSHGHGSAMTLRGAIFDRSGKPLEEWELDDSVCDCCQTSAAMASNGPIVVYRDRSENEIRDISIVRYVNGTWTKPQPINVELWKIQGCPVNGPATAAINDQVAVAWYTAKNGFPQVKLTFSGDAGESFSTPIMVSEGKTSGRVGITSLPDGSVVMSWMDTKEDKAEIMVAQYKKEGTLVKKLKVAETAATRASGFPVIASTGNKVYIAWTETNDLKTVKTAKINF